MTFLENCNPRGETKPENAHIIFLEKYHSPRSHYLSIMNRPIKDETPLDEDSLSNCPQLTSHNDSFCSTLSTSTLQDEECGRDRRSLLVEEHCEFLVIEKFNHEESLHRRKGMSDMTTEWLNKGFFIGLEEESEVPPTSSCWGKDRSKERHQASLKENIISDISELLQSLPSMNDDIMNASDGDLSWANDSIVLTKRRNEREIRRRTGTDPK